MAKYRICLIEGDGIGHEVIPAAKRVLEARYQVPFLAHATMEPMNCVAQVGGGKTKLTFGSQIPTIDQLNTAKIVQVSPANTGVSLTKGEDGWAPQLTPAALGPELEDGETLAVHAVDPELGATAVLDTDRARERAAAIAPDAGGAHAPFAGVPTAFKDNVHVAGLPVRMGSDALPDRPATEDGAFVRLG